MSTQIENLVVSFDEILLQCGNLFDELATNKTSNLVLPKNNKSSPRLNAAIKSFDRSLDSLLIQLSSISLLSTELKRRALEKEKEARVPDPQELAKQQQMQQQKLQQQGTDLGLQQEQSRNIPIPDADDLLKDLNDFLAQGPQTTDGDMNEEFDENIQQLLMESNDFVNNEDNAGEGLVDDEIFSQIDTMLNM